MNKSSGKGGEAPNRKPADPPCLISNTVRTFFQSHDLSAAARAVVDSAKWVEDRQAWALDLTPEAADELGTAALSALDT